VAATIANAYAPLLRAMNRGGTIDEEAPRSQVARDVRAVAALVHGRPAASAARSVSLLDRVLGRGVGHGAR
jgi:Flp pilus assembly CpaE family ATPase